MNVNDSDDFYSGVFSAIQHLVLLHGADSLAKFIAQEHGIDWEWALRESKRTGYQVRRMNRFIRDELRVAATGGVEDKG